MFLYKTVCMCVMCMYKGMYVCLHVCVMCMYKGMYVCLHVCVCMYDCTPVYVCF